MPDEIEEIQQALEKAAREIKTPQDLQRFKEEFLSRKKGRITSLFKRIGSLPPGERSSFGKRVNQLRALAERLYTEAEENLREGRWKQQLQRAIPDPTLPGFYKKIPPLHPISEITHLIEEIFLRMGYDIEDGPEVESEYYNFDALNIPPHHPARQEQDTFFLEQGLILRTHTSPVQIRAMRRRKPPIRIIVPGRVYRRDEADPTHTPMFYQIEGLVVDRGISFAHLKGTLETFLKTLFGEETKVRFRPSYFPFTEPSAEVDISCPVCGGTDPHCSVCGGAGWIEILGSGMVHPQVLRAGGVDPEEYSGFAFGLGVDRISMLWRGISDIRNHYWNRLDFLEQMK